MKNLKKYPLLVCLIVSFVIIIASALVVGLCGVNVGSSLGGGSQMEIVISDEANAGEYATTIKGILAKNKVGLDSCFTEDKVLAGSDNATFTSRVLIVKLTSSNISEETQEKIRQDISEKFEIDIENISQISNIISPVNTQNLLKVGLALGIIAACLFAFGFIRYNVFAGLSLLVSILHNLLMYFSLVILSRAQFNVNSLSIALVMTILMLAAIINIFERNRELTNLHLNDKLKSSQRLLEAEKSVISPYFVIVLSFILAVVLLFLVSAPTVRFIAINIAIALVASIYTLLLVGPGVYAYFLDLKDYRENARLSRNSEVNKHIKKKISKANQK